MDIVYGPVSSWRLGRSLGIDLICQPDGKICSFDCTYCSLGKTTESTTNRREFISMVEVEKNLREVIDDVEADVIAISGTGEPTLAKNLGEVMEVAREISQLPVAVLTNSSLMYEDDVREDLLKADIVVGSLDAPNEELFKEINKPCDGLCLDKVVDGMIKFRNDFGGKFSLEVMFVSENKDFARGIADLAKKIEPDEIQINTPLRYSPVKPLTREELVKVQESFEGMKVSMVYDVEKKKVEKVVGEEKVNRLKRPKEERERF